MICWKRRKTKLLHGSQATKRCPMKTTGKIALAQMFGMTKSLNVVTYVVSNDMPICNAHLLGNGGCR
jgi:hypothetical protein